MSWLTSLLETATARDATGDRPAPRNGVASRTASDAGVARAELHIGGMQWLSICPRSKKSLPNWRSRRQGALPGRRRVRRYHGRADDRDAQEGASGRRVLESCQEHPGCRAPWRVPITQCVKDALTGPLLYAFSQEDPGAAGRLIKEFAKGNDKLQAQAGRRWAARRTRAPTWMCWLRCRPANRRWPCWPACWPSPPPCWSRVLAEPGLAGGARASTQVAPAEAGRLKPLVRRRFAIQQSIPISQFQR